MTRHFIFQVFLTVGILSASSASAQPFGIAMGTPVALLDVNRENFEPGWHLLESVPKTHSSFNGYVAVASPQSGVCAVIGTSGFFDGDVDGSQIIPVLDKLKGQLDNKYGNSKLDVSIRDDAEFSGKDQWTMALMKGERIHMATWNSSNGSNLTDGIANIVLEASAFYETRPSFRIEYQFENYEKCQNEIANESQGDSEADAL